MDSVSGRSSWRCSEGCVGARGLGAIMGKKKRDGVATVCNEHGGEVGLSFELDNIVGLVKIKVRLGHRF